MMALYVVGGSLLVAFVIFSIVCAFKETSVSALYIQNGVYSRFSAQMAVSFAFFGVILTIAAVIMGIMDFSAGGPILLYIGFGLVCLAVGVLLFFNALRKCPDELKKGCITSMIITALGSSLKRMFKITTKTAEVAGSFASAGGFANVYTMGGDTYNLERTDGNRAYLYNGFSGTLVEVWSHGSDGIVTDGAGNLYYPENY